MKRIGVTTRSWTRQSRQPGCDARSDGTGRAGLEHTLDYWWRQSVLVQWNKSREETGVHGNVVFKLVSIAMNKMISLLGYIFCCKNMQVCFLNGNKG